MFWIGFGIGTVIGFIVGIFYIALVSVNHRDEKDDEEQAKYFATQKDRNEF